MSKGKGADYYSAQGTRPVERSHIDFDNDVVLKRVIDNHYNVLFPSGERDIARNGHCLFRAVITSWNRCGLKDAMTDAFISELREHVADYISQNWDTFKDFVEQDNEPVLKAPKHVQPNALQSKSHPFPVTSRVNQAVEVFSLPLMNNVTTVPAFPSSMGTQLGASDNASRVTLSNHRRRRRCCHFHNGALGQSMHGSDYSFVAEDAAVACLAGVGDYGRGAYSALRC
ncbi:hypothetical protein [Pseudomonas chlororaphis]|uniref:hypothetical protein n=1 Tax=Pseudomonas chlororaphis TaxID=587753 RepID=UPI0039E420D3